MIVKDFTMQAIRAVRRGTFEGVVITAVEVTAQAKELCPVADYMGGILKNSIQWVADDGQTGGGETTENLTTKPPKGGAIVGTPVYYGVYQEYGTRKMYAQPFLRPAVDIKARGKDLQTAMYNAIFNSVQKDLPK